MARLPERTLFIGALGFMGAAVLLAYWLLLGRGPAAGGGAPPPPPPPSAPRLEVTRASGDAWLRRGDGPPIRLEVGSVLQESDAIETTAGSTIEIGTGESYQVILDGAARFGVR